MSSDINMLHTWRNTRMHLIALFLTLTTTIFCVRRKKASHDLVVCSSQFSNKKKSLAEKHTKENSSIGRMAFRKNFNRFLPDTPDAFAIMKIMINYRIYGAAVCVWLRFSSSTLSKALSPRSMKERD